MNPATALISLLTGLALGAAGRWATRAEPVPNVPVTAPAPKDPVPAAPIPVPAVQTPAPTGPCADRSVVDALRAKADTAVAHASQIQAAFEQDWGLPPDPPAGFDPHAEHARIAAILEDQPLADFDIRCDVYPCTVAVLALTEDAALNALPAAIGASGELRLRRSEWDGREVFTDVFAVIPAPEAELEARFVDRRLEQHNLASGSLLTLPKAE